MQVNGDELLTFLLRFALADPESFVTRCTVSAGTVQGSSDLVRGLPLGTPTHVHSAPNASWAPLRSYAKPGVYWVTRHGAYVQAYLRIPASIARAAAGPQRCAGENGRRSARRTRRASVEIKAVEICHLRPCIYEVL